MLTESRLQFDTRITIIDGAIKFHKLCEAGGAIREENMIVGVAL